MRPMPLIHSSTKSLARLRVFELVAIELQRARILCNRSLNLFGKARFAVGIYFEPDRDLRLAGFPELTDDRLGDIAHVAQQPDRLQRDAPKELNGQLCFSRC